MLLDVTRILFVLDRCSRPMPSDAGWITRCLLTLVAAYIPPREELGGWLQRWYAAGLGAGVQCAVLAVAAAHAPRVPSAVRWLHNTVQDFARAATALPPPPPPGADEDAAASQDGGAHAWLPAAICAACRALILSLPVSAVEELLNGVAGRAAVSASGSRPTLLELGGADSHAWAELTACMALQRALFGAMAAAGEELQAVAMADAADNNASTRAVAVARLASLRNVVERCVSRLPSAVAWKGVRSLLGRPAPASVLVPQVVHAVEGAVAALQALGLDNDALVEIVASEGASDASTLLQAMLCRSGDLPAGHLRALSRWCVHGSATHAGLHQEFARAALVPVVADALSVVRLPSARAGWVLHLLDASASQSRPSDAWLALSLLGATLGVWLGRPLAGSAGARAARKRDRGGSSRARPGARVLLPPGLVAGAAGGVSGLGPAGSATLRHVDWCTPACQAPPPRSVQWWLLPHARQALLDVVALLPAAVVEFGAGRDGLTDATGAAAGTSTGAFMANEFGSEVTLRVLTLAGPASRQDAGQGGRALLETVLLPVLTALRQQGCLHGNRASEFEDVLAHRMAGLAPHVGV